MAKELDAHLQIPSGGLEIFSRNWVMANFYKIEDDFKGIPFITRMYTPSNGRHRTVGTDLTFEAEGLPKVDFLMSRKIY